MVFLKPFFTDVDYGNSGIIFVINATYPLLQDQLNSALNAFGQSSVLMQKDLHKLNNRDKIQSIT